MDYSEFRRHLGKAGLSVNEFAALIDVSPSSVSNYSAKKAVPRVYAMLAVLMGDAADKGIAFRDVLARFGILAKAKVVQIKRYRVNARDTEES